MEKSQFDELKNGIQDIIDLIASNDNKSANNKLLEISDKLDDFLDHTDEDEDLREISKYQVLLNQLFQKNKSGGGIILFDTISNRAITNGIKRFLIKD